MPFCPTGWCRLSFGRNPFSYKGNQEWQERGSLHHLCSVNLEQNQLIAFLGSYFVESWHFIFLLLLVIYKWWFSEKAGHENAMFNQYILNYFSAHFNKENLIGQTFILVDEQPITTKARNTVCQLTPRFRSLSRPTELWVTGLALSCVLHRHYTLHMWIYITYSHVGFHVRSHPSHQRSVQQHIQVTALTKGAVRGRGFRTLLQIQKTSRKVVCTV